MHISARSIKTFIIVTK